MDMCLSEAIGERASPSTRPDLTAVLAWLRERCRPDDIVEACIFANVPRGGERQMTPWISTMRHAGFYVFVKPKRGRSDDVDADIARHIRKRHRQGSLVELVVASHDGRAFAGDLVEYATDGLQVIVLGYREKDSFAFESEVLEFLDLEELPGVFTRPLPRTNIYDLPPSGVWLAPLTSDDEAPARPSAADRPPRDDRGNGTSSRRPEREPRDDRPASAQAPASDATTAMAEDAPAVALPLVAEPVDEVTSAEPTDGMRASGPPDADEPAATGPDEVSAGAAVPPPDDDIDLDVDIDLDAHEHGVDGPTGSPTEPAAGDAVASPGVTGAADRGYADAGVAHEAAVNGAPPAAVTPVADVAVPGVAAGDTDPPPAPPAATDDHAPGPEGGAEATEDPTRPPTRRDVLAFVARAVARAVAHGNNGLTIAETGDMLRKRFPGFSLDVAGIGSVRELVDALELEYGLALETAGDVHRLTLRLDDPAADHAATVNGAGDDTGPTERRLDPIYRAFGTDPARRHP